MKRLLFYVKTREVQLQFFFLAAQLQSSDCVWLWVQTQRDSCSVWVSHPLSPARSLPPPSDGKNGFKMILIAGGGERVDYIEGNYHEDQRCSGGDQQLGKSIIYWWLMWHSLKLLFILITCINCIQSFIVCSVLQRNDSSPFLRMKLAVIIH